MNRPLDSAKSEVEHLKGLLDDLINSLPSIFVVMNRDAEVVLWNRHAELLTGIPSIEAIGKKTIALLPQFSKCLQHTETVFDQQIPLISENVTVLRNNESYHYAVQLFPLVSEKRQQVIVRIDDITERARLEELMVQNEKMTMVGGLAAGMAHEINNPLAAMMQNAQNIERRISADLPANLEAAQEAGISLDALNAYLQKRGIPEFVSHIREAGSRISKIINNMLRFSNKNRSQQESVNLSSVLEQTLELAASDYDMKKEYDFSNITLLREFDPDVPPVRVTVSEIEHVLLNLLKNAAQAAFAARELRTPRIILRTRKEGLMSVIDIEDNGPGMNESVQRRAFDPFFSTRDVGQGAGLGLSVSYAIISNSYNGRIDIQSRSGEGSCFTICVPSSGGGA